ncbi:mucin-19 isoform X12 [Pleurodeles waltl]|uniref:mucin-19 isoform X12 n=1 Tax=Pleurodeles waltl TaxID=8319 RepID=UPI00370990A8
MSLTIFLLLLVLFPSQGDAHGSGGRLAGHPGEHSEESDEQDVDLGGSRRHIGGSGSHMGGPLGHGKSGGSPGQSKFGGLPGHDQSGRPPGHDKSGGSHEHGGSGEHGAPGKRGSGGHSAEHGRRGGSAEHGSHGGLGEHGAPGKHGSGSHSVEHGGHSGSGEEMMDKITYAPTTSTQAYITEEHEKPEKRQEPAPERPVEPPASVDEIPPSTGECGTWGTGTFRSLNNVMFHCPSTSLISYCRDCTDPNGNGDFNIECKRDQSGAFEEVMVMLDGKELKSTKTSLTVDGAPIALPHFNKVYRVQQCGMYRTIISRRGIASITMSEAAFHFKMNKQYKTCGQCGNGADQPGTDAEAIKDFFQSNIITPSPAETLTITLDPCDEGLNYCRSITRKYFHECEINAQVFNKFEETCGIEYCTSGEADKRKGACSVFEELARQCGQSGCDDKWKDWRKNPDIVCGILKCQNGQVYSECTLHPPATCSNIAPFREKMVVAGCECPEGTVLENDTCIAVTKCPCEYNSKRYAPGDKRKAPCNTECICKAGTWECSQGSCPGKCKVEVGMFITTFDSKTYSLHGYCSYVLAHFGDTMITGEFVQSKTAQKSTTLRSITVMMEMYTIKDAYIIRSDCSITNNKISSGAKQFSSDMLSISTTGSICEINTHSGMRIVIECGPNMQCYLIVPPSGFENTRGLCGSFNNKAGDDFMSSSNIVEPSAEIFSDSWKTETCRLVSPPSCVNLDNEHYAEVNCAKLREPEGVFAMGHSAVDPTDYIERCKFATCTSDGPLNDTLCTSLGNYVKASSESNIHIENWRAGICEKTCPNNQVFRYDMTRCNLTCASIERPDVGCDDMPSKMEECGCPEGQFMKSGGICVTVEKCECTIDYGIMNPGETMEIDDNKCECRNGRIQCLHPVDMNAVNCSGGAEYIDCSDPLTQKRTDLECRKMNLPVQKLREHCVPGCYCRKPMVRDTRGECVLPKDCPCISGAQEYKNGAVTTVGCNNCTCVDGSWKCTEEECKSTCHIYGDGHFKTYDGKSDSFDGLCQYAFTQDYCNNGDGSFRVLVESVPCCADGMTCSRKVLLVLKCKTYVLQDGAVTEENTTSGIQDGCNCTMHSVGLYIVMKCNNGIHVTWDKNTRISVDADPQWKGKLCGICGNYNGDRSDDSIARDGSIVPSVLAFGNSWKTNPTCKDTEVEAYPCDSNAYCKNWAYKKCALIKEGGFQSCHKKVDPTPYYDACIKEACVCDFEGKYQGFCTSVAMYAEACNAAGVCVNWRTPDRCPVFCDYYNRQDECKWHYNPCGTTYKTCNKRVPGTYSTLMEGCFAKCPPETPYLDEDSMKCLSTCCPYDCENCNDTVCLESTTAPPITTGTPSTPPPTTVPTSYYTTGVTVTSPPTSTSTTVEVYPVTIVTETTPFSTGPTEVYTSTTGTAKTTTMATKPPTASTVAYTGTPSTAKKERETTSLGPEIITYHPSSPTRHTEPQIIETTTMEKETETTPPGPEIITYHRSSPTWHTGQQIIGTTTMATTVPTTKTTRTTTGPPTTGQIKTKTTPPGPVIITYRPVQRTRYTQALEIKTKTTPPGPVIITYRPVQRTRYTQALEIKTKTPPPGPATTPPPTKTTTRTTVYTSTTRTTKPPPTKTTTGTMVSTTTTETTKPPPTKTTTGTTLYTSTTGTTMPPPTKTTTGTTVYTSTTGTTTPPPTKTTTGTTVYTTTTRTTTPPPTKTTTGTTVYTTTTGTTTPPPTKTTTGTTVYTTTTGTTTPPPTKTTTGTTVYTTTTGTTTPPPTKTTTGTTVYTTTTGTTTPAPTKTTTGTTVYTTTTGSTTPPPTKTTTGTTVYTTTTGTTTPAPTKTTTGTTVYTTTTGTTTPPPTKTTTGTTVYTTTIGTTTPPPTKTTTGTTVHTTTTGTTTPPPTKTTTGTTVYTTTTGTTTPPPTKTTTATTVYTTTTGTTTPPPTKTTTGTTVHTTTTGTTTPPPTKTTTGTTVYTTTTGTTTPPPTKTTTGTTVYTTTTGTTTPPPTKTTTGTTVYTTTTGTTTPPPTKTTTGTTVYTSTTETTSPAPTKTTTGTMIHTSTTGITTPPPTKTTTGTTVFTSTTGTTSSPPTKTTTGTTVYTSTTTRPAPTESTGYTLVSTSTTSTVGTQKITVGTSVPGVQIVALPTLDFSNYTLPPTQASTLPTGTTEVYTGPTSTATSTLPTGTTEVHTGPTSTATIKVPTGTTEVYTGPTSTATSTLPTGSTELHTGPTSTATSTLPTGSTEVHTGPTSTATSTLPTGTTEVYTGPTSTAIIKVPAGTTEVYTGPISNATSTLPTGTTEVYTRPTSTATIKVPTGTMEVYTGPTSTATYTLPTGTTEVYTGPTSTATSTLSTGTTEVYTGPTSTARTTVPTGTTEVYTGPTSTATIKTPTGTSEVYPVLVSTATTKPPTGTTEVYTGPTSTATIKTPTGTSEVYPVLVSTATTKPPTGTTEVYTGPTSTATIKTPTGTSEVYPVLVSTATTKPPTGTTEVYTGPTSTATIKTPTGTSEVYPVLVSTATTKPPTGTTEVYTGPTSTATIKTPTGTSEVYPVLVSTATTKPPTGTTEVYTGPTSTAIIETTSKPPGCCGTRGEMRSYGDVWNVTGCLDCECSATTHETECKPMKCGGASQCNSDEKYIPPKSTCCGTCEPVTCRYNDKEYPVGSVIQDPSNPCLTLNCTSSGLQPALKKCPSDTGCPETLRVYSADKCCYTCQSECAPAMINVRVSLKNCSAMLVMAKCVGDCRYMAWYDHSARVIRNGGLCCTEEGYDMVTGTLDECPFGTAPVSYDYRNTTSCTWKTCAKPPPSKA